MSLLPRPGSSPHGRSSPSVIFISDDVSPGQIAISSDPPSARCADRNLFSGGSRLRSITDRSVSLGTPILRNRPFSFSPVLGSPTTKSQNLEQELAQLREQCAALQTANGELKGRVRALRYFILSYMNVTDGVYSAAYEHLVSNLSKTINSTRSDVKTIADTLSGRSTGPPFPSRKREYSNEADNAGPSQKKPKIFPTRVVREPAKTPGGKVSRYPHYP